jgi:hypothetical protein
MDGELARSLMNGARCGADASFAARRAAFANARRMAHWRGPVRPRTGASRRLRLRRGPGAARVARLRR